MNPHDLGKVVGRGTEYAVRIALLLYLTVLLLLLPVAFYCRWIFTSYSLFESAAFLWADWKEALREAKTF